jgi:hyaluronate lyase
VGLADWHAAGVERCNVLVYPQVTSTQISTWVGAITHFTPSPIDTGANLMWTSEIASLSGVLVKSSTQVAKGISSAPTVLNIVTSGDGFYADGSFIQHTPSGKTTGGFAYTGGYGSALIEDLINFTTVYAGTQWALSSSTIGTESALLMKSFAPFIYKGGMMDDVRGRDIARWSETGHSDGRNIVAAFLHAATNASANDAATLNSAAKYWIQQDTTFSSQTAGFDIPTILQAETVLNNSSIKAMAEPTGFHLFSGMDRVVHLQPGWGSSVSMWSARHGDYESINSENLKGWYTGNGMMYVYDADLNQYENNYWPTIDSYFQQGTTVLENTSQAAGATSASSFVGGVPSWDGSYGMVEMRVDPSSGSLTGNKAWFFLDDQIMCLGSAIASSSSAVVRTVVANRQLTAAGTNTSATPLGTSNSNPTAEPGTWYTNGSPINWMWVNGNVAGSSYGAYFPVAIELQSMREARMHAWSEINTNANYASHTTQYTDNYYYSTINHGASPSGASYAYAVLPTISQAGIASYAAAPEVTVLENDSIAQAISDMKLGAEAAVFWQSETETVGSGTSAITSDSKQVSCVCHAEKRQFGN